MNNYYRLDLVTLKIFATAAQLKNITRAAEQEHLAASAVSKRLSDLEIELDAKLFYRMPRGVELTPAGHALYHHALVIFKSIEQLSNELSDFAGGARGHVRMLSNKSALIQFMPEDIKSFTEKYPDVKIDLREENSAAIVRAVADGHCDVGIFVRDAADAEGVETYPYRSDQLVLIAHPDHPLAKKKSIRLKDALSYDFVGFDVQSAWQSVLSSAAQLANASLNVRFRATGFDSVARMVSANLGIAVGPAGMLACYAGVKVKAIRLDEPWAHRQIEIAVRDSAQLSAPAKHMLNHLRTSSS